MYRINTISPQIIHVNAVDSIELGKLFIRMQEFYECPNEKFRGKYFSLDDYAQWYADFYGAFTYYEDWAGYNLTGETLIEFYNMYSAKNDLRPEEQLLFSHLDQFIKSGNTKFSVIGTHGDNESVLKHELRHSYYYLSPEFKEKCDIVTSGLSSKIKDNMSHYLLSIGYDQSVVYDETQAYLGGYEDCHTDITKATGCSVDELLEIREKYPTIPETLNNNYDRRGVISLKNLMNAMQECANILNKSRTATYEISMWDRGVFLTEINMDIPLEQHYYSGISPSPLACSINYNAVDIIKSRLPVSEVSAIFAKHGIKVVKTHIQSIDEE